MFWYYYSFFALPFLFEYTDLSDFILLHWYSYSFIVYDLTLRSVTDTDLQVYEYPLSSSVKAIILLCLFLSPDSHSPWNQSRSRFFRQPSLYSLFSLDVHYLCFSLPSPKSTFTHTHCIGCCASIFPITWVLCLITSLLNLLILVIPSIFCTILIRHISNRFFKVVSPDNSWLHMCIDKRCFNRKQAEFILVRLTINHIKKCKIVVKIKDISLHIF